ncbi:general secretion pathway protein GspB [Methylomicrobium lacus]|uniref:general secretion pathway protein GspB n=1 Tax=Methylomicrobium lacus TaxID=136992 RepID=UPI0035A884F6
MSYILNALRKSEQERQAKQPETVTEQVLMPPPQKSRKTALLIGGLLAVNLLALPLLVWYLKNADEAPVKPQAAAQPVQAKAAQMPPLPVAVESSDDEDDFEQDGEEVPEAAEDEPDRPAVAANAKSPSIEELAAAKQAEEQKAARAAQEDKKAPAVQTAQARPAAAISPQEQLRQKIQSRRAQRLLLAENANSLDEQEDDEPEAKTEAARASKTDDAPAAKPEIPSFKDLPYDFRSSVPKMTINVFMYDNKPEDRFVVLNMTKYKAGQTTKDAVEIKEIRADGVVASYGGKVFRIERP